METAAVHASELPSPDAPPFRPADHQRLWTPWRMRYVGGGAAESGCIFCRRLAANDDLRSLILHRGRHAFAIMNLYPYNTGHLMLVPCRHVATPEDADPAALTEIATLLPRILAALRRVLACDGFNVGFNVGAIAGAGVADHLHEHVVPRWEGDANFMPILASTMVLPELIPVTYAKVRAELGAPSPVTCVTLTGNHSRVLVSTEGDGWRLPVAAAESGEPLWRAASRVVGSLTGAQASVIGWAGPVHALAPGIALTLELTGESELVLPSAADLAWIPVEEAVADDADGATVASALANLPPTGGAV